MPGFNNIGAGSGKLHLLTLADDTSPSLDSHEPPEFNREASVCCIYRSPGHAVVSRIIDI
jgi:hypothetical protein